MCDCDMVSGFVWVQTGASLTTDFGLFAWASGDESPKLGLFAGRKREELLFKENDKPKRTFRNLGFAKKQLDESAIA